MLKPNCFALSFKVAPVHYLQFYSITNLMTCCNTPRGHQASKDIFLVTVEKLFQIYSKIGVESQDGTYKNNV